jgi:hypothetical protein
MAPDPAVAIQEEEEDIICCTCSKIVNKTTAEILAWGMVWIMDAGIWTMLDWTRSSWSG